MKLFAKYLVPLAAFALMGGAACGKKAVPPAPVADAAMAPEADTAKAAEPDTAPAMAAPDAALAAPDTAMAAVPPVDYIRAIVNHHDAAKGLVTADFKTFKVIEANVDLTKLETAKAVIEVDVLSITTGIDDRDKHVKSPDFLDTDKFAKATVTVDRLKPVANVADIYDATATVDLHGMKKEIPIQFTVVEKKADGAIVIEGEAKDLQRAEWGMTAAPEKVNVAATFTTQVRLTLTNVTPAPAPMPAP